MDIDLSSPGSTADPYPGYESIRTEGPVVWNSHMRAWMVPDDALCRRVLANHSRYTVEGTVATELFGSEAFIAMDAKKRHDDLRRVWEPAFRPASLERLRGRIAQIADELMSAVDERLRSGEPVEVVSTFCRDLPVLVVCELFGIDPQMRGPIVQWSEEMVRSLLVLGDTQSAAWQTGEAAKRSLADFLLTQIRQRRRAQTQDLIGQIVHSPVGQSLSDDAIMYNCRQLLFAGNETTARWLAQGITILGQHPAALRRVATDLQLIPGAMEEVMRWDCVDQIVPRRVREGSIELAGQTLQEGDDILVLLGAANRDPQRHTQPALFDIHRVQRGHPGFGMALHFCLGAPLARLEAHVAMTRFLQSAQNYALTGPLTYSNYVVRSPDAVTITLQN